MGSVWLAEDTRLHRQVALKTLRPADDDDAPARARLMREARAAAALNHPHIAAVYDVLENDGHVVIVFEYVEGETLAARLARDVLPVPAAIDIACQIAGALVAAHAHGVVHRDLKPANVITGAGGQVKVLDFGIARILSIGTTKTGDGHTATGIGLIGTPAYAAPEQMVSGAVDERADLYALGVMLFEMISGRRPFTGSDPIALASSKLGKDAPPLSATGALVPRELQRLVASLLSRERDERPASAADVLARLRAIDGSPGTTAPAPASKRRVVVPVLATALVLAALVSLGVWGPLRRSSERPDSPPVVAVLPLANISGDGSKDFLAAGIAESLISSLAALPTVTVLSRASVTQARSRTPESSALARDLGATYLVEGSVQESGGRLRVSLNLVRPDRSVAWADNVEGVIDQIFDLQSRLAVMLTAALDVRVSAAERRRMNSQVTTSPEALNAYWQGRALLDRRDVKGNLDAAVTAFNRALALDARFAVAQAALGEAFWTQYVDTREPSWAQKATEAGLTALRLDPNRAEVRYTLAVTLAGSGRPDEAIEELHRALAMQPNYDDARRQLGQVLGRQGRVDEAVAEYRKALALTPNSSSTYGSMGLMLLGAARYDDAIAAFQKATELQPDNYIGFQRLGTAYQTVGKVDLALENYEQAIAIRPSAQAFSNIGALHHGRGDFTRAVEAYRQAIALRPNASATRRNLGDALARLGRAADARAAYLEAVRLAEAELKVDPNDARTTASLAVYLAKAGQPDRARQRIDQALRAAAEDVEVIFRAAVVAALRDRSQDALAYLAEAVRRGYSRASILDTDEFGKIKSSPAFVKLMKLD
jgi:serine/threonine-protein kinase